MNKALKGALLSGLIFPGAISSAATRASADAEGLTSKLLLLFLICCWIIGMIDAYRIGRQKDLEEGSKGHDKRRFGNP